MGEGSGKFSVAVSQLRGLASSPPVPARLQAGAGILGPGWSSPPRLAASRLPFLEMRVGEGEGQLESPVTRTQGWAQTGVEGVLLSPLSVLLSLAVVLPGGGGGGGLPCESRSVHNFCLCSELPTQRPESPRHAH